MPSQLFVSELDGLVRVFDGRVDSRHLPGTADCNSYDLADNVVATKMYIFWS